MNLFNRAKEIGLQSLTNWLPNGRTEGNEYICLNPTRPDRKEGSFKINMTNGKWSDFSTGDCGNDVISLFAYVNRDKMHSLAIKKNYKNLEGGIQAEAAREILTIYDWNYFPKDSDTFQPKYNKNDFWLSYHQARKGTENPPDVKDSIDWFVSNIKNIEKFDNKWSFTDKKGNILFYVVRFFSNGKKDDRPFSLWYNGNDYKWRCKGFADICKTGFKIPLYNRHKFETEQNLPVLMVEGQKCAQAADELLSDLFLCTSEYGGLKNAELEVLRGKTVYRWIDPDNAGVKKLVEFKQLIKDFDINLHVVKSPVRKPQGWDIADAINEGWTKEQLVEHIESTGSLEDESFVEDGMDFKIIGVTNTYVYFFPKDSKQITWYKKNGITKNAMMHLMEKSRWEEFFYDHDKKRVDWDNATNYIMRQAANAPFYYNTMIRGAGAWKDRGRLVLNCGNKLIVDGKDHDLYDFDSDFIYEKKDMIPYTMHESFSISESKELLNILGLIRFSHPADYLILAGWILLAPFGGALKWRPKVWISGPRGAGKTYIIDDIITPILGKNFGHIAPGTSSEAAIRRQAGTNSLPNIHDEMESDNRMFAENINNILMFYRVGSSGDNGGILKVSESGDIQKWISQCMALFASIGAAIKSGADKSRITVINMKSPKSGSLDNREERFKELSKKVEILTESWSIGFNSRTLQIWPEVEKCIKVMVTVCSELLGTRREGDQIGTLLAGAYMIDHDKAPIASEASEWVKALDIDNISSDKHTKLDEELVIDEILSHKIRIVENVNTYELSISNLLIYWFMKNDVAMGIDSSLSDLNYGVNQIKISLTEYGILPVKRKNKIYIQIAKSHPKIKEILKNTPWQDNYTDFLKRLLCCDGEERGPYNFSGINKRFVSLKADELLDPVPF